MQLNSRLKLERSWRNYERYINQASLLINVQLVD